MKNILYPIFISIVFVSLVFIFFEDLENYFTDLLAASEMQPERYALLSFLVLASDILLPVPSSIIMYYNGLVLGFAYGSLLSLVSLFISGTAGYWIGYTSAFGFNNSPDEKAGKVIEQFGSMGIILTRGIPILSESICITAGFNRMNFRQYTILNILGSLPLAFIYGYFGAVGRSSQLFYYSFGLSILLSLVMFISGRKILGRLKNEKTAKNH